ncbi:transcriptional regulator with XRE-family HTH domain [Bacillus velezensis]|nr:hypothetical protein UZ38_04310 [Bacillus amyloliquefaciens]MDF9767634.1 transcriptional regulator with XRE-family HTH domain [Bacillus velezensis]MDF9782853.1 transcriptional regulator with XRE-family HTH domain [Bacillus velezensis]
MIETQIGIEIGMKVKEKRNLLNLTQTELADKLQLSRSYISKIENGQRCPNLKTLNRISIALDESIEYFF